MAKILNILLNMFYYCGMNNVAGKAKRGQNILIYLKIVPKLFYLDVKEK